MYEGSAEEDYFFVQEIHGDVSRTFDLALDNLPEDLIEVVRTSYLMCRIPDTIEDSEHIPVEKKPVLLDHYHDILAEGPRYDTESFVKDSFDALEHEADDWTDLKYLDEDQSYWELLENTDRVFNVFERFDPEIRRSVEQNVGEMVEGMRDISSEIAETEAEGIRIDDFEELADYNFIVAGTVGNLLTDVFTHKRSFEDEERLYELSEDFGHFLQTVNIIKDPYDDYVNEDAVFAPDSLAGGNFHEEIIKELETGEADKERLNQGMVELVDHADRYTGNVVEYIDIIENDSKGIAGYLQVPALLAVATLREAKENPLEAFKEEGIKIGRTEAITINQKAGSWKDTATAVQRAEEEPIETLLNRLKVGLHDFKSKM